MDSLNGRGPCSNSPGVFFSVILAIAAISRSTSYWYRPPIQTPAAARIEGIFEYRTWAIFYLMVAVLILLGVIFRNTKLKALAWGGHILAVGAYTTLGLGYLMSALIDGFSWSVMGLIITITSLHAARAQRIGEAMQK